MEKNQSQGLLPVLSVARCPHPSLKTPGGVYSFFREETGGKRATKGREQPRKRAKAHGFSVPGMLGWPGGGGGSRTQSDRKAPPHPQRKLRKQDNEKNWSCPRQPRPRILTRPWTTCLKAGSPIHQDPALFSPRVKWREGGGTA